MPRKAAATRLAANTNAPPAARKKAPPPPETGLAAGLRRIDVLLLVVEAEAGTLDVYVPRRERVCVPRLCTDDVRYTTVFRSTDQDVLQRLVLKGLLEPVFEDDYPVGFRLTEAGAERAAGLVAPLEGEEPR